MLAGPTPRRRHVVLKINSAPLEIASGSRGFVPLNKCVVGICILVDDGHQIARYVLYEGGEGPMLTMFWSLLKPYDVIIGEHGIESDFALIRQRTFVQGLAPKTELELQALYSHDVIDLDTRLEFHTMAVESGFTPPVAFSSHVRGQQDQASAMHWAANDWGVNENCQSRVDALYTRLRTLAG